MGNFFIRFLSVLVILQFVASLVKAQSKNGFDLKGALIPVEEIRYGGPPRDGIPSIDNPEFVSAELAEYPADNDRVLGIVIDGVARAYPIGIMNYHEIVNDFIGARPVVVTYCPLCGSGIAFDANVRDENRTFGVSGLLYNSDVLLYDRESGSLWSQLMTQAISGPMKGQKLIVIPTANTTWREWKMLYPNSGVLTRNTGYSRDYSRTPYSGYEESEQTYFPVSETSNLYHNKEFVIGIEIDGKFKAYPFSELQKSDSPVIDKIGSKTLRIYYNQKSRSARIEDNEGKELPYYTTFWFAWYTFHPKTRIYTAR